MLLLERVHDFQLFLALTEIERSTTELKRPWRNWGDSVIAEWQAIQSVTLLFVRTLVRRCVAPHARLQLIQDSSSRCGRGWAAGASAR